MNSKLSFQARFVSSFSMLALAACTLAACGGADAGDGDARQVDPEVLEQTGLTQDMLDEMRTASDPEAGEDAAFQARLEAETARAEAYLQAFAPKLDAALRETGGVGYDALKAEVDAALALGDAEKTAAALAKFEKERGGMIEAALEHMGMSSETLAEALREASRGEEALSPFVPVGEEADGASYAILSCQTGYEYEPLPPYYEQGAWGTGYADRYSGYVYARSYAVVGGAPTDGAWVRADNIPPAGGGTTTVSTRVRFTEVQSKLVAFLPAYAGSGVGLSIQVFDNGPWGPMIGNCRRSIVDLAIGLGWVDQHYPGTVNHSCSVIRDPGSTFLTTHVQLDTYATTVGAEALAQAWGYVETIRYWTCQDL